MLPFLKHQKEAGSTALPEKIKREPDFKEDEYDMLEAAAEDLKNAIKSDDIKAIAQALRAAFDICESQPHEEGEHI